MGVHEVNRQILRRQISEKDKELIAKRPRLSALINHLNQVNHYTGITEDIATAVKFAKTFIPILPHSRHVAIFEALAKLMKKHNVGTEKARRNLKVLYDKLPRDCKTVRLRRLLDNVLSKKSEFFPKPEIDGLVLVGNMGASNEDVAEDLGSYIMKLMADKGPAADISLTENQTKALWTMFRQVQDQKISILIANDSTVTTKGVRLYQKTKEFIKKMISKMAWKDQDGHIEMKVATTKSISKQLKKKKAGYKYIVIAAGEELRAIHSLINNEQSRLASDMKDVRLLNMEIPAPSSGVIISERAVLAYQVKALMIALQARVLDSESDEYAFMRAQLETMLRPMLGANPTKKDIANIMDNLDTKKEETSEQVQKRINNTVKGKTLKLINTLQDQIEVTRMFGRMA